jgi:DNA-binding response OmpR family regulator
MEQSCDVLVVEDDATINALIGAYIELAGMSYRSALDGASALAQLRKRPPQLVVLDVMLPDTDGFEVCRRLKQELGLPDVPVVMLTALADESSRQRGLQSGATIYLNKPFDPDRFLAVIKQLTTKVGRFA